MTEDVIEKRVGLVSMNLFNCEVDDSDATISLHKRCLKVAASFNVEEIDYSDILSIKKRFWWYEIAWLKDNSTILIKISSFKLKPFVAELQKRIKE